MHGPTCICWANLTPFPLKVMVPRMDAEAAAMFEVRGGQLAGAGGVLVRGGAAAGSYRTAAQLGMVPSGEPHVLCLA